MDQLFQGWMFSLQAAVDGCCPLVTCFPVNKAALLQLCILRPPPGCPSSRWAFRVTGTVAVKDQTGASALVTGVIDVVKKAISGCVGEKDGESETERTCAKTSVCSQSVRVNKPDLVWQQPFFCSWLF